MSNTPPHIKWQNVDTERQYRGEQPATAYIDMVSVELSEDFKTKRLIRIDIIDSSTETIGDMNPSLIVMAITIGTR